MTAGEVLLTPAVLDMTALLGDPERMGRAFGWFGFVRGLGYSIGPVLGGLAFDYYQQRPYVMWSLIAGVVVAATVGFAWFLRRFPLTTPPVDVPLKP